MSEPGRRKVFITGGTGSLGSSLVKAFDGRGFQVTFQYANDATTAALLAKECRAEAVRIDFLTTEELPDRDFDILINNAGINICSLVTHEVPRDAWDRTIRINLLVPFLTVGKYLPLMIEKGWGRVINISSIYGLRGVETNLPYNVSKHGLSGLTKTVAKEYARFGITCNEICPGPIDSRMMHEVAAREARDGDINRYFDEVCEEIPARRMAKSDEVAALALFLASNEAQYINGSSLVIDGGLIA